MTQSLATTRSDNGLSTQEEFSTELAPTAAAEAAKQEVQAAVILAKRFPRNEDAAYAAIIRSCKRPTFAGDVSYSFPRGGSSVTGPSIYLAREFARVWGNIRHGVDVVADTPGERTIRAWAWDLETNVKVSADATFRKLIQRKDRKTGETKWVEPDERDLRELTNKHAALAKRNCLLELLPSDMVEDAQDQAVKTLKNRAAEDPDGLRKILITSFGELNVPIEQIEKYLGHPIAQSSPEELVDLRSIYKSIKDGNSKWTEYLPTNGAEDLKARTQENAAALKEKMEREAAAKAQVEADAAKDSTVIDVEVKEVEDPAKPDPAPKKSVEEEMTELLADVNQLIEMKPAAEEALNGRVPKTMDLKQLKSLKQELAKL